MELDQEARRSLASLKTVRGYRILIALFEEQGSNALIKVKASNDDQETLEAAKEWRFWERASELLRNAPDGAQEGLKAEGDEIYG